MPAAARHGGRTPCPADRAACPRCCGSMSPLAVSYVASSISTNSIIKLSPIPNVSVPHLSKTKTFSFIACLPPNSRECNLSYSYLCFLPYSLRFCFHVHRLTPPLLFNLYVLQQAFFLLIQLSTILIIIALFVFHYERQFMRLARYKPFPQERHHTIALALPLGGGV